MKIREITNRYMNGELRHTGQQRKQHFQFHLYPSFIPHGVIKGAGELHEQFVVKAR